jgi:peptidyl-lysine (3S)-dioxygenase / protease
MIDLREDVWLTGFGAESSFPCATYVLDANGKLKLEPLSGTMKTPCSPVDPSNPDLERFPRFRYAKPITVTVREGEMLYLPGMWFGLYLCVMDI